MSKTPWASLFVAIGLVAFGRPAAAQSEAPCAKDSDCPYASSGQTCQQGRCVTPPPPPAPVPVAPAAYPSAPPPAPSSEYPPPPAPAAGVVAAPPPARLRHFGIGYKIGDGMGFANVDLVLDGGYLGLSLLLTPLISEAGAHGFGAAPEVVLHLRPRGSTPYIGAGFQYAELSNKQVSASATGIFANVGYEWRLASGLDIQLGGGVQHINGADATGGSTTIHVSGATGPNLEVSVRYMF